MQRKGYGPAEMHIFSLQYNVWRNYLQTEINSELEGSLFFDEV
jgi:hypothetical protein